MRVSRAHAVRKGLVSLIALAAALPGLVSSADANAATTPVATQISAGLSHTCVVVNGGAKCWGRNIVGQLGDGTTSLSHEARRRGRPDQRRVHGHDR